MTAFLSAPGLIADIGGTNARFALVGEQGSAEDVKILPCAEFGGLFDIVRAYLAEVRPPVTPRSAAIAIASPVTGDTVAMTNLDWRFSIEDTRRELGLERLDVVNDFMAVALAVPHLKAADLMGLGGGTVAPDSPCAVIGPGTGLGVAAVVPTPGGWVPLSTEGGHVTMAATEPREAEILAILRERFGHVSAERVLSGPGLVNLFEALSMLEGTAEPERLEPVDVTGRALDGSSAVCREALDIFLAMLGTAAGNLALTLGARGGVYIAGGIVPRMADVLAMSAFRTRFEAKGRFREYLKEIPTAVVLNDHPALLGLGRFVQRS